MKKFYFFLIALFVVNGASGQWVSQNSGTTNDLTSIYFTDSNNGFIVGKGGIIFKTTNGGLTWLQKNSGTSINLNSVYYSDSNSGYIVGDQGVLLKSNDAGENWTFQNLGSSLDLNSVYFTDINTGYIAGGNGDSLYILKTANGGNQWTMVYLYVSTPNPWYPSILYSIHFADNNTGYAVGTTNLFTGYDVPKQVVLKTTDGGSNWTQLNTPESGSLYSVYFTDTFIGYCVGSYLMGTLTAVIRKTTDGGISWTAQEFPEFDVLRSVCFTGLDTGYSVGSWGNVIKTTDGGATWVPLESGISYYGFNAVYFPGTDTGYIAGDNGIILKTTNGGGFPVGTNESTKYDLRITNYPNPVTQSTTFSYILKEKGHVTIQIFNSFGQLVAEPFNAFQTKREQKVIWNTGNLPAGIYFYRLTTDDCRLKTKGKLVKY